MDECTIGTCRSGALRGRENLLRVRVSVVETLSRNPTNPTIGFQRGEDTMTRAAHKSPMPKASMKRAACEALAAWRAQRMLDKWLVSSSQVCSITSRSTVIDQAPAEELFGAPSHGSRACAGTSAIVREGLTTLGSGRLKGS